MSTSGKESGKGLTSSALLVAAVLLILVAGMFLRSGGRNEILSETASASAPLPALPLGAAVAPESQPATLEETAPPPEAVPAPVRAAPAKATLPALPADPLVVNLATRARADCGRLAGLRGRFTAQLIVACKPETVDRLLAAAPASTRIYVLPASVNDDACFRVCFGDYPTLKDAAAAADLPKTLRGKEKIAAVEIAKVLP